MPTPTRSKFLRAKPIFLLEIDWGSFTYRFATKPVHLLDDGLYLPFTGSLENPDYVERSELLGVDIEDKTIPLALYFAGVDISLQEMRGSTIEGSLAELSYILEDVHTNYNERIILAQGIISQPVYGHPDRPKEYVECSLESQDLAEGISLIAAQNARYILTEDVDTAVTFDDRYQGKVLPIIFGQFTWIEGIELYTIPGYYGGEATGFHPRFYISCHHVLSTSAKVKDRKNHTDTGSMIVGTVTAETTSYMYTGVMLSPGYTVENPTTNTDVEYWVHLDEGLKSPYSDGVLEGAGDLCLWALTTSGIRVDYNAWYNVRTFLNEYKFAGVLQDDTITGLDWLKQEVLPYLPIEIVLGNDGLSPRLNLMAEAGVVQPIEYITAGAVFFRAGPVIPITEPQDICNAVMVRFAWEGMKQSFYGAVYVGPDQPQDLRNLSNESINEYSLISVSKYGLRRKTINLNFVYDYRTASRIAQEYIRFNSQPRLSITYRAVGYYGWLQVGDVVELTDPDINIDKQKVQILSKKWVTTHWEFILELEINHISNKKMLI